MKISTSGPVFTKGLRLSQVLGLNVVLKLRLLSQLSPRLSYNHSGFLGHVTFYFYLKYNIGDKYPSFDRFYLRISAVLKWKTLLPHINFQRLL